MDVDDKVSYFATISWNMAEKYFPLVTVKLTDNDKEWMTPYAKLLIQQKQRAHIKKDFELRDSLAEKLKEEIKKCQAKFSKKRK